MTTDENVWVIQASGNIGKDEKIEFNGYSVKVHEFIEDRVALAVYKENNFLELFEFYEDERRQYEDISVGVHRIDASKVLVSFSVLETRTVWTELEPARAFWGDYIVRDQYEVEINSFYKDSVNLIVYENEDLLAEDEYYSDTEQVYLDDFKIYVSGINSNGYVDIHFFKKLPLHIDGIMKTQKDVYRPDENIKCRVEISNSGNTSINLMEISLTTDPSLKNMNPVQIVHDFVPDKSCDFDFSLTPYPENENSNIFVDARLTLIDYYGKKYTHHFSKNIYISSNIGITKEVNPSELEFHDDSGKTHNVAMVTLTVFNVGTSDSHLTIHDVIPEDIRLYNSTSLEWTADIQPDGIININYHIIPDIPGTYTLPPAEVSYNTNTLYSGSASFTVHGPLIFVEKTANIINGTVEIACHIYNIGDRAAHVTVIDHLPESSTVIDGKDFWTDVMQPGEYGKLNYTIQYYEGLESLPGARIEYQDIRGNNWYLDSNPVILKSVEIDAEVSSEDMIIFLSFSYFAILGTVIILLLLIGSVFFIRDGIHD